MSLSPVTRASLLVRLRDHRDGQAWEEFVAIYEPLIYRLVRGKGVQHADAEELTQNALVAVAAAIGRWDADPSRGSFRGWLNTIVRNMLVNYLTRSRPGDRGAGGTDFHLLIAQAPDRQTDDEAAFERERREAVLTWAAGRVRGTVQEANWQAFWQTAVEGRPIEETARAFGLSVGALYAVRSRVMAKLKRAASEWEADLAGAGEAGG